MALPCAEPSALAVRSVADPVWLRFVEAQPDATVFHHPAWSQLLAATYGYQPSVLVRHGPEGQITAGLPVVDLRTISGRRVVSLPFTDYCPPLAPSPSDQTALARDLIDWRIRSGARDVLVHGELSEETGIHHLTRGVRHILPLRATSIEMMADLKGGMVARAIRKAQRHGLDSRIDAGPAALDPFYRLHLETRRRLGVPVQPKRFFENLWNHVLGRDLGFAVVAYRGSDAVAAAVFLAWNGNLVYKFGASDRRYWELRPNNLVMWTAIEWACRHGFRTLDFGRSDLDNRGLRDFKSHWGAAEVPLVYSVIGRRASSHGSGLAMRTMGRIIRVTPPVMCRALGEVLYRRVAAGLA